MVSFGSDSPRMFPFFPIFILYAVSFLSLSILSLVFPIKWTRIKSCFAITAPRKCCLLCLWIQSGESKREGAAQKWRKNNITIFSRSVQFYGRISIFDCLVYHLHIFCSFFVAVIRSNPFHGIRISIHGPVRCSLTGIHFLSLSFELW